MRDWPPERRDRLVILDACRAHLEMHSREEFAAALVTQGLDSVPPEERARVALEAIRVLDEQP